MRRATSFLSLLLASFFATLISAACIRNGIPIFFRIWEFPFDGRILPAALLLLSLEKGGISAGLLSELGLRKWQSKTNAFAFFGPAILLALTIGFGLIFGSVKYQEIENAPTFLLASFLDIPATCFFSLTTLLLEEVLFRGYLLNRHSDGNNPIMRGARSALLWSVFRAGDFFQTGTVDLFSFFANFSYLFSLGLLLAFLFQMTQSIWPCYFFRVGSLVFSSMLLNSTESDLNSFFFYNSTLFSNFGVVIALLNSFFAFLLMKLAKTSRKT